MTLRLLTEPDPMTTPEGRAVTPYRVRFLQRSGGCNWETRNGRLYGVPFNYYFCGTVLRERTGEHGELWLQVKREKEAVWFPAEMIVRVGREEDEEE